MKWDESLSVGCELVDSQHKELICLVDQLETSLEKGLSTQQIGDALKFIVNYTRHHFSTEEKLMQCIGFDALKEHKEMHNKLIQDVTDILLNLRDTRILKPEELVIFLVDWVKKHVTEEDIKIGIFWNNKKSAVLEIQNKIKAVEKRRTKTIAKLEKLKDLYRQKLIEIEDYKEQKVRVFASLLGELGINHLAESFADLDFFLHQDIICNHERKPIIVSYLEKSELEKGLGEISELDGKLLFLRSFHEFEMINDLKFEEIKARILSAI